MEVKVVKDKHTSRLVNQENLTYVRRNSMKNFA